MTVKEQILELFDGLPDVDRETVLQELNLKMDLLFQYTCH
ncbi:hypothetical protein BH23BAC1_BH23BAC1_20500 [soil metagenome]